MNRWNRNEQRGSISVKVPAPESGELEIGNRCLTDTNENGGKSDDQIEPDGSTD